MRIRVHKNTYSLHINIALVGRETCFSDGLRLGEVGSWAPDRLLWLYKKTSISLHLILEELRAIDVLRALLNAALLALRKLFKGSAPHHVVAHEVHEDG